MEKIFVARQRLYDRQLHVFAYELLYRSGGVNQANVIDGDRATSESVAHPQSSNTDRTLTFPTAA